MFTWTFDVNCSLKAAYAEEITLSTRSVTLQ